MSLVRGVDPAEYGRLALIEKIKREQLKRARNSRPTFGEWLPQVTPSFTWDWKHLRYVQNKLDLMSAGKIRRLMVFLPPRHGKSEQLTIRYPAYELEAHPEKRIVVAAYGATLAESFTRRTRAIVRSRDIVKLDRERQSVADWRTMQGGGVRAVGVGGAITGMGMNLGIIDDPVKSREEADSATFRDKTWTWFTDDFFTRQEPNASIVLQMTRWHWDDLAGRIIENIDESEIGTDLEWHIVTLPALCKGNDPDDYPHREIGEALCPQRYDEKDLAALERTLGNSFEALFQQSPTPESGDVFKKEWFEESINVFPNGKITQTWDLALETGERNDYSAMVQGTIKDGIIYVAAFVNQRMEFPDIVRSMKQHKEMINPAFGVDVCVEDKASGKPARQTLRREGVPIIEIPAGTTDKTVRAKSITSYCEAGHIVFVNAQGNCNEQLKEQLMHFPNGVHDDLVDSFVHLVRRLTGGARKWNKDDLMKFNPNFKPENNVVGVSY